MMESSGLVEALQDGLKKEKMYTIQPLAFLKIKMVPFKSLNNRHVFELFNEIGVEKTRNLLKKR